MDTYITQGTEWYNLLSEEGKKLIDERDEKWRKVFPNSGRTDNESALQAFSRKAQSFPLRYDHFDLPAPTESFQFAHFLE
ncbi:hypothetical protein L596_026109 [Steinernema carpocapsae]|uniref:Uncharacterized protein n=1 Tax=Steinernema carpocapsae TaxID=34508 RepID=A0A4V5ZY29_STECR|nr:hypothetical protein L596_026109 [Steinernema carpocapsae]